MVHSYPPDYIPLGEAFENALLKLEKVCRNVEVIGENEFWQRTSAEMGVAASSFDDSEPRRRVELLMRDAIIEWKLRPYRMDPASGQIQLIYIDPNEWMKMSFFPGLESVDEEGVLRLLKISEFEEWLAQAQALQSDETFERVSPEACGVSSSEPSAAYPASSVAQVAQSAPSPPADGITSEPGAAQAPGDSGTPVQLQPAITEEDFFSRKAAAKYLSNCGYHIEPKTLANLAYQKKGPLFTKLGGKSLRYTRFELDGWVREKAASADIDSQKK